MDSRLRVIQACLDDARTTCADMLEENVPPVWELELRRIRKLCNDAILALRRIEDGGAA
jgi:hypothetical protein